MHVDQTVEELEKSLCIPSFEEELAASSLPGRKARVMDKAARIVKCATCGSSVVVGPYDEYRCPNAPHDKEDDNLSDIELAEFSDTIAENAIDDEEIYFNN